MIEKISALVERKMDRCLPVGLRPKKRFGQNFLVDEKVVASLVAAADLKKSDTVIEVGAGTGVLTKELARRAGKVLAFEIDHDLIPVLQKNLSEFDNVEIISEDFLKVGPQQFIDSKNRRLRTNSTIYRFEESPLADQSKLVGSIPYQITSPLLHKLLTFEPKPSLVVLLIQKEVAEKITARPPKATYLSNTVKLLGEVGIVRSVPKNAFWPVPEVDGAIVKIVCSRSTLCCLPEVDIEDFQKFLHRGFQNPRKMLRTKFDIDTLKRCGIDSTPRAQTLGFNEWLKLYKVFSKLSG